MPNEVTREQWVAALRSGKYVQGQNRLRSRHNTYCCLGVFCDLADPDAWESSTDGWFWGDRWDIAPIPFLTDAQAERLANLNDRGSTFNQIADEIERKEVKP